MRLSCRGAINESSAKALYVLPACELSARACVCVCALHVSGMELERIQNETKTHAVSLEYFGINAYERKHKYSKSYGLLDLVR